MILYHSQNNQPSNLNGTRTSHCLSSCTYLGSVVLCALRTSIAKSFLLPVTYSSEMAASISIPEDDTGADGEDPLHSLKQKIIDQNSDIGLCLWRAAEKGSAKQLKLILQLPYGETDPFTYI